MAMIGANNGTQETREALASGGTDQPTGLFAALGATEISDDMESDNWTFSHTNPNTDCTWSGGYSTTDYTSPVRSIRLYVADGGMVGRDADRSQAYRDFPFAGTSLGLKINYKVAQQTDGPDAWGGACSYTDVIVYAYNGEGIALGSYIYRLSCVRSNRHNHNYDTGNITYILPEGISRDSDGDIHLARDTWYMLDVSPSEDLNIDWASVKTVRVLLRAGGSFMHLDAIEVYFDDLKLITSPLLPLHLSLNIEDALEGITVNKVVGDLDGPTKYTRVEIVTKLISYSASAKDDIPVVLTIPDDLFGPPIGTWVRNTSGGARTSVSYESLGGGQYRGTTDLSPVTLMGMTLFYRKQIVWRFLIPNDTLPQNVTVSAVVQMPCVDPSGTGTIRILAPGSVHSLIIANRKLLYDKFAPGEVTSLLQRLFTEAQGPPASHSPRGVIYYVERYH
jgi:hypothetical protein